MAEPSFLQVQNLIDRLTPLDQVRLMEYISLRIEKVISAISSPTTDQAAERDDAWVDFFRIGDELLKGELPKSDTLTSTLLSMRR
jgi:hypothetical protein